jgi:hypothetical protein
MGDPGRWGPERGGEVLRLGNRGSCFYGERRRRCDGMGCTEPLAEEWGSIVRALGLANGARDGRISGTAGMGERGK